MDIPIKLTEILNFLQESRPNSCFMSTNNVHQSMEHWQSSHRSVHSKSLGEFASTVLSMKYSNVSVVIVPCDIAISVWNRVYRTFRLFFEPFNLMIKLKLCVTIFRRKVFLYYFCRCNNAVLTFFHVQASNLSISILPYHLIEIMCHIFLPFEIQPFKIRNILRLWFSLEFKLTFFSLVASLFAYVWMCARCGTMRRFLAQFTHKNEW